MIQRLGVVMDPIASIHFDKDTTLAMLFEAQNRGYEIFYFEGSDLYVKDGVPFGRSRKLHVSMNPDKWFSFSEEKHLPLSELNIILMRIDPPFNLRYIYLTYILELAERLGVIVANRPQALRDCNEKFYISQFPECIPPTLITASTHMLADFLETHGDIVCKPLDTMGGANIERVKKDDKNAKRIFNALTLEGTTCMMAQRYIPEIVSGDKRILLINGEPIPFALARVPHKNDWRGNLAQGATGVVQPLTSRDLEICAALKNDFRARGLYFVGIDVIGDYLTEINVTSPTCLREIERETQINISGTLFDACF